ncbi:MAG: hypothetical protein WBL87_01200 [Methanothrix sp.]
MASENVEMMKVDAKKAISDLENIISHAKAEAKADVEKVKAKLGHGDELEKKAAYAKADTKADAQKAKADLENKLAHEKTDTEKEKAEKAELKVKIEIE